MRKLLTFLGLYPKKTVYRFDGNDYEGDVLGRRDLAQAIHDKIVEYPKAKKSIQGKAWFAELLAYLNQESNT